MVVPVHGNRDLPVGTLRAIPPQTDLSLDEISDLIQTRWPTIPPMRTRVIEASRPEVGRESQVLEVGAVPQPRPK